MIYYLTYNDAPSGVYFSQVTDTCSYISNECKAPVKLIAFISIRSFFKNRKLIRHHYLKAIVLPMFPRHRNWRFNTIILFFLLLFRRRSSFIARGPFAVGMLLKLKKAGLVERICFDGRGAYSRELNEYEVIVDDKVKKEIYTIESDAVLMADFHIAVSHQLVSYWREWFGYYDEKHTVIPCTFNSNHCFTIPSSSEIDKERKVLGYSEENIVLVYSGSVAGWQSLKLVDRFLISLMSKYENVRVLFLANVKLEEMKVYSRFPQRIQRKWLCPEEITRTLTCCDYGILIREKSVTNKVASPTKFAEYLVAGLPVLISEDLGDYSEFVEMYNTGYVINETLAEMLSLRHTSFEEKLRYNELALRMFSKSAYKDNYLTLIRALS